MKRSVTILLPIAMLVVGSIGGWFASAHSYNRWIGNYMKTSEYNRLSERCRVLTQLRAGKTSEAAMTLEMLMDGDILGFGSFVREMPPDEHRAADMKLLATVRDYRVAHPWKAADYPDIDKGVAEVFTLVSTNNPR
jgi:hypothetical protein